jgi:hypothetical protein
MLLSQVYLSASTAFPFGEKSERAIPALRVSTRAVNVNPVHFALALDFALRHIFRYMAEVVTLSNPHLELKHGLQQYGGGRGVFATAAISAGDLVLREAPFFIGPKWVSV